MPTAPRSPTHEMNSFSRLVNRNGQRLRNTAAGRAMNISVNAIASAGRMVCGRRLGQASRPRITNMPIWASQVTASRNVTSVLWARVELLPTTSPAI